MTERVAVVLFNLGGPDGPDAVRPFLFNLFNDPAILRQPRLVRWCLARLIANRRAPAAQRIYAQIGGRSPILEETAAQARALEAALDELLDAVETELFVCMRYWHPMTGAVVDRVKAFDPDRIVLLPLYPQFSSSTTASSFAKWDEVAAQKGLDAVTVRICCWPDAEGFVEALASLTADAVREAAMAGRPRVLFSAHGLPRKFVLSGDPYQRQVECTVAAVVRRMAIPDLDHVVCYQSRIGPLEWLKPYTEAEVVRASREGRAVVVVPVAFVSEHSETLVELDRDYAALARKHGAAAYVRVPTVSTHADFIAALARLVGRVARAGEGTVRGGTWSCPAEFPNCPHLAAGVSQAA